jgi:hypothetical protein
MQHDYCVEKCVGTDIFRGNPEGKVPLGRSTVISENNIKMDHKEVGHEGLD